MKKLFTMLFYLSTASVIHAGQNFGGKYYDFNVFTGKQDLYVDSFSQLKDSGSVIVPAVVDTTTVIMNTPIYEPKQFNVTSGTVSELNVSTGAIKLAQANLEMNGNIQYLSKDKHTYVYFDEVNRWIRYYIESIEAYRIEK